MNVAILASGTGTNALALIDEAIKLNQPIRGLICDKENAPIIEKARALNVDVAVIPRIKNYRKNFEKFELLILKQLKEWNIDWVFLAGFMAVLGPAFLKEFLEPESGHFRVINIHPSLLPAYKGINAYEQAFQDKVSIHGATVHFVTEGVDCGPVVKQCSYPVPNEISFLQFVENGKLMENKLYREVFRSFIKNQGKLL